MPGGPTMKILGFGELWREAKGLESLGVGHREPARAGVRGGWDAGKLPAKGESPQALETSEPMKMGGFAAPHLLITQCLPD